MSEIPLLQDRFIWKMQLLIKNQTPYGESSSCMPYDTFTLNLQKRKNENPDRLKELICQNAKTWLLFSLKPEHFSKIENRLGVFQNSESIVEIKRPFQLLALHSLNGLIIRKRFRSTIYIGLKSSQWNVWQMEFRSLSLPFIFHTKYEKFLFLLAKHIAYSLHF